MDHSRLIGSIHNIQLHEGVQNNNFIGKKRDWNPSPLHSYQQTHQKDTVPQFYKCFGHLGHAFWINILRIRERKRARCLFWYPHLKVLTCTFAYSIYAGKWYLYMASRFTLHILNLPKVPSFPLVLCARTMKSSYLLVMSSSCRSKRQRLDVWVWKKHVTSMFERIGNFMTPLPGWKAKVCSNALRLEFDKVWCPIRKRFWAWITGPTQEIWIQTLQENRSFALRAPESLSNLNRNGKFIVVVEPPRWAEDVHQRDIRPQSSGWK